MTQSSSEQVGISANGRPSASSNGHKPAEIPIQSGDGRAGILVDGANDVMRQFQTVMQRFLDTQQNVMLAYLRADATTPTHQVTLPAKAPVTTTAIALNRHHPTAPPSAPCPEPRGAGPLTTKPAAATFVPSLQKTEHAHATNGSNGPSSIHLTPAPIHTNGTREAPKRAAVAEVVAIPTGSLTAPQVTELLLGIVSERTGYPCEMLGLDADLEADLGIDSIKRVEIVGSVVRGLTVSSDRKVDLEPLTGSKTLRALIAKLVDIAAPPSLTVATSTREGDQRPFEVAPPGSTVSRFLLRSVAAHPTNSLGTLSRAGVVLMTDDELGVGKDLAGQLTTVGYRVVRCVSDRSSIDDDSLEIAADLGTPDGVARLVDEVHRKFGLVTAIVHLAPLRSGSLEVGLDRERWHRRLAVDVGSLFLLTKALAHDLESAGTNGGAAVIAAASLGGDFATSDSGPFFAGHGGIAGYLKSVAQEVPLVRIRAVDVGTPCARSTAAQLWAELFSLDEYVEIGYVGPERVLLRMVESPVAFDPSSLKLDDSSVILVTGGARGITAEVARQLVQHCRPTLVLVGRTSLSTCSEHPEFAGIDEPLALRRQILDRRRTANEDLTPRAVESDYQALVRSREVRHNLDLLRATGARVEYHDCDVSNRDAFGALLEQIYERHGRIDGVIHGAGVIEDKLIQDKSIESFNRVVRTKVDSALVLAERLRPDGLRFVVFFSSIAGRLGNRGQSDYAAANEIINKLAQSLARSWSRRVVAINWGPWATLGMATAEIQRQFADRGMAVVPVDVGRKMFVAELAHNGPSDVEVVVAGGSAVTDVGASGVSNWGRPPQNLK